MSLYVMWLYEPSKPALDHYREPSHNLPLLFYELWEILDAPYVLMISEPVYIKTLQGDYTFGLEVLVHDRYSLVAHPNEDRVHYLFNIDDSGHAESIASKIQGVEVEFKARISHQEFCEMYPRTVALCDLGFEEHTENTVLLAERNRKAILLGLINVGPEHDAAPVGHDGRTSTAAVPSHRFYEHMVEQFSKRMSDAAGDEAKRERLNTEFEEFCREIANSNTINRVSDSTGGQTGSVEEEQGDAEQAGIKNDA